MKKRLIFLVISCGLAAFFNGLQSRYIVIEHYKEFSDWHFEISMPINNAGLSAWCATGDTKLGSCLFWRTASRHRLLLWESGDSPWKRAGHH